MVEAAEKEEETVFVEAVFGTVFVQAAPQDSPGNSKLKELVTNV